MDDKRILGYAFKNTKWMNVHHHQTRELIYRVLVSFGSYSSFKIGAFIINPLEKLLFINALTPIHSTNA